ncbi:MAG: lysophospholipid acyltransferase family protein [Candidatus Omnitrophica bacterium]|nr:lysophospholipid acyltransferase family protein [Candidatus Omnitrophota bacterium]
MSSPAWAYAAIQGLTAVLPRSSCEWIAERLADAQCRRAAHDREAVRANLSLLLNRRLPADAPEIREVFRQFAQYLLEFLSAHRARSSSRVEETAAVTAGLRPGQGAVILSAHLGNWELGAVALHRAGCRMSVVALPHGNPRVNEIFEGQRRRCGVEVIPLAARGSTARCLQRLREGWLLGILGDREFGRNGIPVTFLDRVCLLPKGPALLSLRSGAPAVPVFVMREGPWRLRFHVEPPIPPSLARGKADPVQCLTQLYAQSIERMVRRFPTQWVMFQPFSSITAPTAVGAAVSEAR